jgi:hypothetical protein
VKSRSPIKRPEYQLELAAEAEHDFENILRYTLQIFRLKTARFGHGLKKARPSSRVFSSIPIESEGFHRHAPQNAHY